MKNLLNYIILLCLFLTSCWSESSHSETHTTKTVVVEKENPYLKFSLIKTPFYQVFAPKYMANRSKANNGNCIFINDVKKLAFYIFVSTTEDLLKNSVEGFTADSLNLTYFHEYYLNNLAEPLNDFKHGDVIMSSNDAFQSLWETEIEGDTFQCLLVTTFFENNYYALYSTFPGKTEQEIKLEINSMIKSFQFNSQIINSSVEE